MGHNPGTANRVYAGAPPEFRRTKGDELCKGGGCPYHQTEKKKPAPHHVEKRNSILKEDFVSTEYSIHACQLDVSNPYLTAMGELVAPKMFGAWTAPANPEARSMPWLPKEIEVEGRTDGQILREGGWIRSEAIRRGLLGFDG